MKNLVIAVVVGFVTADFSGNPIKPKLSLTLTDGTFDNLQSAFAPRFSVGGTQGPFDYGATFDATPATDLNDAKDAILPKSVWAQGTALDIMDSGWSLKGRAEFTQGHQHEGYPNGRGVYLTVEVKDDDYTAFGWCSGHVCLEEPVPRALKFGAKKVFDLPNTANQKVMVEPRYSFEENGPDLCLGYERDDTRAYLTVSRDDQNFKVVQKVKNTGNVISCKAGRTGFVSASLTNDSDLGQTKLTVTKDSVDVELKTEDGWLAGFHLDGMSLTSEPSVRFKKTFDIYPSIA
mmetsp:Transcript_14634/g.21582  ORF Transcript_14634/g.21582 Transcript_14634/m.21582 type:complete len:290 (-) Transcript_14634:19-888(-)